MSMKKNKKNIFIASFLICSLMPAAAASAASLGDVNGDGSFNVSDIKAMSKYFTGASASIDTSAADFDGNGKINIVDLIKAKNTLLENGSTSTETQTTVKLNGSSISVTGKNATASGSTLTITGSGIFNIEGKLSNGQIIVDVDKNADPGTVKLFFNGVDITCTKDAPVYIKSAENTSINLADDTVNYINDGSAYNETEAAIYAKDDLTIKGNGRLEVHASTYFGIHCSNDLKINGGDIYVLTDTEDAVRGKDSVTVKSGKIFIDSAGDGIKSTQGNVDIEGGTVQIKASSDAIQAETTINISGGDVTACGDRGLTSVTKTNITGGSVLATSSKEQVSNISCKISAMTLDYAKEWKKNNPIALTTSGKAVKFEKDTYKKFSYAFIADESLNGSYTLYTGGINTGTVKTGSPAKFTNVNNESDADTLYSDLFDQTVVHNISINMPESDWEQLKSTATKEEYFTCDLSIDGVKYKNCAIRTKGFSSLSAVAGQGGEKFSFRIKLDKYEKYQNYKGLTEFCVNNLYGDSSGMRDTLCYDVLHELGAYAPDTAYTDVYLNGKLFSFYILCEVPAETMGENFSTDNDATIYKADQVSCTFQQNQRLSDFSVKYGPDEQMTHITEVVEAINKVTPDNYKFIEDIVDVSSFLKGFAVNCYMCNTDSYNGSMAHNYYLLWNDGKMSYVAWDYNLSLGAFMGGTSSVNADITTGLDGASAANRPLVGKLLAVPEYYDEYIGYVKQIANYFKDPEARVNKIDKVIGSHIKADPRYLFTYDEYVSGISKSAEGLQVSDDATGGWGNMDWGNMDWGGFGGEGGDQDWANMDWGNMDWGGFGGGDGAGFGGGDGAGGFGGFGGEGGDMDWANMDWGNFDWGAMDWGADGEGGADWGNMDWGGFEGGGWVMDFGGTVSVTDFLIKRYEVVMGQIS